MFASFFCLFFSPLVFNRFSNRRTTGSRDLLRIDSPFGTHATSSPATCESSIIAVNATHVRQSSAAIPRTPEVIFHRGVERCKILVRREVAGGESHRAEGKCAEVTMRMRGAVQARSDGDVRFVEKDAGFRWRMLIEDA